MATVDTLTTFTNQTNADATAVNSNFTKLRNFLINEVIHKDASVAFTGIPTLPATTPSNANHAVRKGYVDAIVLGAANLAADSVETAKIKDGNVTAAKLNQTAGSEAVVAAAIRDSAVQKAKIQDGAVDHVKRKRGDRYNREAGTAQTVTNNQTDKLTFGSNVELDTFTNNVTASGSGNFTLPSTYTGDYSVMIRLSNLTGTWNTGKVKLIFHNGDRAYRFVCNDLEGGTYGGVFQLTEGTPFYVQLFNDGTGGAISTTARLEVRQLS